MPRPTVRADFDKPLDIQGNFAAKVALNLVSSVDDFAQPVDLLFGQVADTSVRIDVRLSEDLLTGRKANTIDIGKADLDPLLARNINACNTCHALPLPLLVLGIGADDHHGPVPSNYFAVVAAGLDGCSDFQLDPRYPSAALLQPIRDTTTRQVVGR